MKGRKSVKRLLIWLGCLALLGALLEFVTSFLSHTPVFLSRQIQRKNVRLVGFTGGAIHDIFVKDNIAYCACGHGLSIFDVSDPTRPKILGSIVLPDSADGVYVSGSYAYVADRIAGLRVIDVSNPSSPKEVGNLDTLGCAKGVYVSGQYAYVAIGMLDCGS